jgi:hypothetical protein
MLRGPGFLLNHSVLDAISIHGGAKRRQLLQTLQVASIMPAVVHRSAMPASRQPFEVAVERGMVPFMFSTMSNPGYRAL